MLLVYSSGSILLLVLYSPLAFPSSLPPSSPALSRLCAHCTTKGWSQGCGIQATPLMPVCVCVFITHIYFFFPPPPTHCHASTPNLTLLCRFLPEHYKAQWGSRHVEARTASTLGFFFLNIFSFLQNKKKWKNLKINASAIFSPISHRPEQEGKKLHLHCPTWGNELDWTTLGNHRKALKCFAVSPINHRYAKCNLSWARNQVTAAVLVLVNLLTGLNIDFTPLGYSHGRRRPCE